MWSNATTEIKTIKLRGEKGRELDKKGEKNKEVKRDNLMLQVMTTTLEQTQYHFSSDSISPLYLSGTMSGHVLLIDG